MKDKRVSVRFDDRMWMLLDELSEKTGVKRSVIVRAMIDRGIEALLDSSGNWRLDRSGKQQDELYQG